MTRRNAPLCCKRRGRRGTFDSPAAGRWQRLCSSGRDLARRLMLRRICIRLGAPRPPQSGFFLGCLRRSRLGPQITILWQQIARSGKPHAQSDGPDSSEAVSWRHILRIRFRTRSRPPRAALAWCCSTARGANCGRERVRGLYNLCRSIEALRAASPVHEQRGDVDNHRLPLLVFFRRQHGEGLAPLQSIDCTFHQRLLFC